MSLLKAYTSYHEDKLNEMETHVNKSIHSLISVRSQYMPARRAALDDRERPGDRVFALGDTVYERYLEGCSVAV